MPSRSEMTARPTIDNGSTTVRTTTPSTVSTTGGTTGTFTDPAVGAALTSLILELQGGGTAEQRRAIAQQDQTRQAILQMLGAYTPGAAQTDAVGASNLAIVQAIERSLPQITAAVNAAGTSGGGTQAGLTQKSQRDAALAADNATSNLRSTYAGTTATLSGVLANLANNALGMQVPRLLGEVGANMPRSSSTTQTQTTQGGTETSTVSPLVTNPVAAAPENTSSSTSVGATTYAPGTDDFGNTVYRPTVGGRYDRYGNLAWTPA